MALANAIVDSIDSSARELTPLLIYQMGKVGSRTVQESLARVMPSRQELYHLHQLHDLDRIERDVARTGHVSDAQRAYFAASRAVRRRFDARDPEKWDVITLVRDPVRRNLSAFFYGLADDAPSVHEEVLRGAIGHSALLSRFLEAFDHGYACNWLSHQFQPVFDLDLLGHLFPVNAGYQIVTGERVRVLVLRTEDLDRCLEPAVAEFLGWSGCAPKRANRASEKGYATTYREFLESVVIPDEYLDRMYGSPLARHFYSPPEIAAFRRRWRKADHTRSNAAPLVPRRDSMYTCSMANQGTKLIQALGADLERAWAERDFDPDSFIDLSTSALANAELARRTSGSELLAEVAADAELPAEQAFESRVVDEQITLFRCPRFVIQLLVWVDGITDIHDHRLSGAYIALEGDRIESRYRFSTDTLVDDFIRVGRLEYVGMERVSAGQVLPFTPGTDDLHAVFHLHHPSVTIAIRAPRLEFDAGFNYLRPGLAVRTKITPRVRQRIGALHTLHHASYPAYAAALERALLDAEPLELFLLLNEHRTAYAERVPELRALLSRLRDERGPWIDTLARAFAERTRMILIRQLRQAEHDFHIRLALALILHARTLDDLPDLHTAELLTALDLIGERVPPLRADVERLKAT